jgi:hypothetical protein
MTPIPNEEEFKQRHVLNLIVGYIHILALKEWAFDGNWVKDKLCDFLIGSILWSIYGDPSLQLWTEKEAEVFQVPFIEERPDGRFIRKGPPYMVSKRYGDPFLGPDGKVLELAGLVLHGNLQTFEISPLSASQIRSHPNYDTWLESTFFSSPNGVYLGRNHPAISKRDPNNQWHTKTRHLQSGDLNPYERKRGLGNKHDVDALVNDKSHAYRCSHF